MRRADESPGGARQIGPYRVLDRLSAGGMGVVYRAQHVETAQAVALKTVRVPEVNLLHSIRREIHALRRLQHPGVVQVLAEGVEGGLPWYAMELLEGITLRKQLATWWPEVPAEVSRGGTTWYPGAQAAATRAGSIGQGPAGSARAPAHRSGGPCAAGTLGEVLTLVRRLCDVLAFIHGEGVVHRDLKPENIVLRPGRLPVLVDFGLVSAFGGARGRESLEVGGSFEGSVEYVSPEQVDCKLVDARADLYALGCILYELVTGQPPFRGTGWEVLLKHLSLAPIPPSELVDGVPGPLEELILQLLAKHPRDRIGYASDVAAALTALGAEQDAVPAAPGRPYLYRPEFAGRSELLAELERRLEQARAGRGGCVFVAGESGTGKTRLAMELATTANRRSFRIVTGECLPLERTPEGAGARGAPLHPFKSLFLAIADHCRTRGPETTERILGERGRLLAFYEPALALLPGQESHPEPARLSAQAAHDRLLGAFAEVLAAFAAAGEPLLLVLDDLQWADALSLDVLAFLQRNLLRRARVLVLGTYRTDEESEALRALSQMPRVAQVRLGALDQATVGMMVRDMLALPSPPAPFIESLTLQSEGNPFFLSEYLRAAIDEGLLRRNAAGRWHLLVGGHEAHLYEALPLSGALRDLVGRRLLGLSDAARFLIEVSSVLGREFDGELLAEVAGLPDEAGLEGLDELLWRNAMEEVLPGRFRFVHDKLREVAYETLTADRRGLLHQSVAEALEARYGGSAGFELLYPALAHHWSRAGVLDRTLVYLEKAGEGSLRAGANAEAVDFFRRALALEGPHRDERVDPERRAGWERLLGEALYGMGDVAGGKDHLLRALEALGWPMPATSSGWVKLLLSQVARQTLHLVLPARGMEAREGERERLAALALAAARLSECYYFNQEMVPTVVASVLAVNLAERAGRGGEIRRIYGHLGYVVCLAKLHPLARRYFARAQENRRALEDPGAVAYGGLLEGMYHMTFGRYGRAGEKAHEALRLLPSAWDDQGALALKLAAGYVPPEVFQAEVLLGQVDFYEGRLEESLRRMEEARELARAQANLQYEAWTELDMARALIALDRLAEAVELLRHAQQLLAGKGDRSSELQSHGLLARAYLEQGELERAREVADGVVELLGDVQPSMFTEGVGFEGIALVYLAAWEREGTKAPAVARKAWYVCKVLARFALLFPLAVPAALRCEGRAHWLAGHAWRARWKWRRSLKIARRLGMPFDVARAHLELGRYVAPGSVESERHLIEADQWLSRLGRTQPLRELEELRRAKSA